MADIDLNIGEKVSVKLDSGNIAEGIYLGESDRYFVFNDYCFENNYFLVEKQGYKDRKKSFFPLIIMSGFPVQEVRLEEINQMKGRDKSELIEIVNGVKNG